MVDDTVMSRLEWLCGLEPGTVWTEYHWREALDIRQEVIALLQAVLDGRLSHKSGGDSGMIFDEFDAEVERRRKGHWAIDDAAIEKVEKALVGVINVQTN